MSEVLISPNFDKSLSDGSFVELNDPSSNNSPQVTFSGLGRSISHHDHTHINTSYDTPTFRLPLKQAAKTLFREKATSKFVTAAATADSLPHHHHHHHHHHQQQHQHHHPHHLQQSDPSFHSKVNKGSSHDSDCSTSVQPREHQLLSNALTCTDDNTSKHSTASKTPFVRSSIIYNVLNGNNTNDIIKQVTNCSKKSIPLKVSSNDNNIQRLSHDDTVKIFNSSIHSIFENIKNSSSNNNNNNNSNNNNNCSDIIMLSSPNSSSPCDSPRESPPPSLVNHLDHASSHHHHHHHLHHHRSNTYRLNSLTPDDHQMATMSPKSAAPVQKIINRAATASIVPANPIQIASGSNVIATAASTSPASGRNNNSCSNGNGSNGGNGGNQLDHQINENAPRFGPGRRDPKCARCQNHNVFTKVKGHKLLCPFKHCKCKKCRLVKKRQKIMAKQVKVRRAQTSYGENRLESDQIDALIGDDDIDDGDDEDDADDGENNRSEYQSDR